MSTALGRVYEAEQPGRYSEPLVPLPARTAECPNPDCGGGWMRLWRRRQTPVFEGACACGEACLRSIMSRAVRREMGEGHAQSPATLHRHRVPLGLVLLAQGWITQPQLQQALAAQRQAGEGRIGSWLMSECGLREERVTLALSLQWSCPVLPVDGFEPERMARIAPRFLVETLGLLPLRIAGARILYVGSEDSIDASAAFALERMTGLRVESGLVNGSSYARSRERLLSEQLRPCFAASTFETVRDLDALSAALTFEMERSRPVEARLVRLHGYFWLRMWLRESPGGAAVPGVPVDAGQVADRIYRVGAAQ